MKPKKKFKKLKIKKVVQGYKMDAPDERDDILGAVSGPVVLPSGNWRTVSLPDEFQATHGFENYGCVSFSVLNAYEKLAKIVFGEDWNKAERFTYITSDTDPSGGNSPRKVADSVRHCGIIDEAELPFDDSIDTIEKFNSPKPLTEALKNKGKESLNNYDFRYNFLPKTNDLVSRETLREALKRSPVAIAVYAWAERDGIYVRPEGMTDTHLTLLENVKANDELEILDSYPPANKTLDKDFPIYTALGFRISKKIKSKTLWQKIIAYLIDLFS